MELVIGNATLYLGDCRSVLKELPDKSVQCCVTSPPYYGLRDYGTEEQIGLESIPEAYVTELVSVFREVRRVLRDDGTCWLNLGDSYGPKKQLIGIPWRVAFALQSDGWYLRQDIIWQKQNPMPESVKDRCTKSHEYVFMLTKSSRYFWDHDAIKEKSKGAHTHGKNATSIPSRNDQKEDLHRIWGGETRNRQSVWTIASQPYAEAHFATMPPELARLCILAGSRANDVILDPFNGAGTTGMVAVQQSRRYIGVELNHEYLSLSSTRIEDAQRQQCLF